MGYLNKRTPKSTPTPTPKKERFKTLLDLGKQIHKLTTTKLEPTLTEEELKEAKQIYKKLERIIYTDLSKEIESPYALTHALLMLISNKILKP